MKYVAKIGDRTHSLDVVDDRLFVDGQEVHAAIVPEGPDGYTLFVDQTTARILVEQIAPHRLRVTVNGYPCEVDLIDEHDLLLQSLGMNDVRSAHDAQVRAPMPGLVRAVHVEVGDRIESGAPLLVLEAMKMENELQAKYAAVVHSVRVQTGDAVEKDQLLVELAAEEE